MKKRFIRISMIFIIVLMATISINIIIYTGHIQNFPINNTPAFMYD